ncbi:unnamed protein product [Rotaria socialis]|uniref:Integral membrane bound transporter domain-containing protein n=2 Tax=Rotaria socialis TaxID=392032 RepID=A0A817P9S6_9BILA|nr:unnamed protein product [Rotaria socialis]CAF4100033.1 unnamed protein product [Rotaria socialis]
MASWKQSGQYTSRCTCWYPLLPSFSARIIFALRNLIGIACCALLALVPVTSKSIQGQILLGLGFIIALKSTLGATIQASSRLFFAGAIAATYCVLIINYLPRDVYFAVGATNVFVFLMVYTDLPQIVRRFSILPTCIILLQWFDKDKSQINTSYVLQSWASLPIGGAIALLSSCIPLPAIPTAHRELTIRMRFIARQIRREITAIVLLISEYHNVHLTYDYHDKLNEKTSESNTIDEDKIELPKNSYHEDDPYNRSASFENLKDDHLLESDIQDLYSLVQDELKQMERALTEIPFEPYFISLKLLNLVRKLLRCIPFLKKFIKKPSTLQSRLEVWATGFVSLQRIISGMLSLNRHHHAFVGQRKLINAICILIDTTFNFLEATLPYTIHYTSHTNTEKIISCRLKVEAALEDFFETYAQVREDPKNLNMSNTDSISLNTFLLLVLRLVHVTITAAETSETPGTCLDIGFEQTMESSSMKTETFKWNDILFGVVNYIGLRPSVGKFLRATKTSLSVLVSAIVALTFRERLQAQSWVYWAPMTTALVSDSSEGGTIRLSFQRLVAVLLGSTYAYIIVLVSRSRLAIGICISLFVAFMGYIKTDAQKEYFAVVCGQSASIITFLSNQEGFEGPNKAVLARTSLTFLGIFIHVFISNLLVPISARKLAKKRVVTMINNVSAALKSACDDFCFFIGPSRPQLLSTTSALLIGQQTTSSDKTPFNLMNTLAATETIVGAFPALLEEALSEPNFWKSPFIEVKDRYDDISKTLHRIVRNIRFVHRCTTILKAETKLHFALEARWQLRRASVISSFNTNDATRYYTWTRDELRKQKQVQNDLDIPLSIFMTNDPHSRILFQKQSLRPNSSSTSLRLANNKSYELVLQHISTLETNIQQVILLAKQLIENQATVDVGSFELHRLCHEDLSHEEQKENSPINPSNCHVPLNSDTQHEFHALSKSSYNLFPCCKINQQKVNPPLPSLRIAVDMMLVSLIEFLYANNHFIRTELVSIQSIGDILAFHTLSYSLQDMVEATTDLAKNARRIKRIDIRTLVQAGDDKDISY